MAAIFFGSLGTFLVFYPTLLSGFSSVQPDPGDIRFINYLLEHTFLWLKNTPHHLSLWDPPIFYPAPGALAFSDTLLSVAPLYWVLRLTELSPDTAIQLFEILLLLITFAAFYLLIRKLSPWKTLPCALGAFLIAFGSVRTAQLGHPQLLTQFFTVPVILGLSSALRSRRPHGLYLASAGFVAQLYSSFYLAWFSVFCGFLLCLGALFFAEYRKLLFSALRDLWPHLLVAITLGVITSYPCLWRYYEISRAQGTYDYYPGVFFMLPILQSWFFMGENHLLYGLLAKIKLFRMIPNAHEQHLGMGFATLAVCIHEIWRLRRSSLLRWLGGISLLLLVLCTAFPFSGSLWHGIFTFFPGAQGIRAVSRIGVMFLIPAGFLLACFAQRVTHHIVETRKIGFTALLLVFCVLEQAKIPTLYSKQALREEVSQLTNKISDPCGVFFYLADCKTSPACLSPDWRLQLNAMWAALGRGIPTVNGFSGKYPPGWNLFDNRALSPEHEIKLRAALDTWWKSIPLAPKPSLCIIR